MMEHIQAKTLLLSLMKFLFILIIGLLLISITNKNNAAETIYKYKNSKGEIVYTDVKPDDKKKVSKQSYENMTNKEIQDSKEKLEQIIVDAEAFDEQMDKDKSENAKRLRLQKEEEKRLAAEQAPKEETEQEANYEDRRRLQVNPSRPIARPVPKPRPKSAPRKKN